MIESRDLPLLAELLSRYSITDNGFIERWFDHVMPFFVPRGGPIAVAGEASDGFYVIADGLVRYFYADADGKEWNKAFFREGQFIGSLSAYLTQRPLSFNIVAMEPCRLYRLPLPLVESLKRDHANEVERVINAIARELFVRNEQREAVLLTGNASQRYNWMLTHERWLLDRVPQYQLASYLGMDPVSLSRLKSRPG